ncbi:MAG: hypothetical protein EOP10_30265 [Proteobacteria bacterium]|nr:MAG: hypothetical protein EOP10_30265 [Pseudomonadota bacterium]
MGSASATVELNSLASDDSGTLYAAGTTPSQLPSGPAKIGTKDGFLIKVNPTTGATTWLQTIGTTNGAMSDETESAAVVVTRDGSQIYLMGSVNGDLTASGQDDDSIYLAKYSSSGTGPIWVRQTKDGNGPKRGLGSVALSPDESRVTFVGTTSIELIAGNNLTSSHLYKFTYDTAGNQTSFEQIASDRSTKVRDLSILADGSFIATGYTDSSLTGGSTIGSTDWFVVKFASNLTRSWLVERGMSGRTSQCMGSALDSAGNIITAGFSTGDLSAGSGAAPGGTAGYLLGFKPDGAPF